MRIEITSTLPKIPALWTEADSRKVGERIVEICRAKTPVRSGNLRDSIQVEEADRLGAVVGSDLPYAAKIEALRQNIELTAAEAGAVLELAGELALAHLTQASGSGTGRLV